MYQLNETKRHLMAVLKTPYDCPYVFVTTHGGGTALVQRIRVELSRIRKQMTKRGIPSACFKLHASIRPVLVDSVDEITLTRTQSANNVMSEGLSALIKEMSLE